MTTEYTLMNKNHPVLGAVYDDELQVFTKLEPLDLCFASPALLKPNGMTDRRLFNEWWSDRAVPSSRMERSRAKDMLMENLGLSLSDCYWMNPGGLVWEQVNLFENGVSPMEMQSPGETGSYSPEASTGGDLPKQWRRSESVWELVKQGSGTMKQEPYNEVVATALHRRLLNPDEYVPYHVENSLSVCPNMLRHGEELVTAWDVIKNVKKPNDRSNFQHCFDTLSRCFDMSPDEVNHGLEKMFVCDVILANSDRHYRNFGLIRDTDTLRYTKIAPVYDSGSCLWYDKPRLVYQSDYDYETKPFGMPPDKLLEQFHDMSWFDPDKLKGFTEEAAEILAGNPYMPDHRLNRILEGLNQNVEAVSEHAASCQKMYHAGFTKAVGQTPGDEGRCI